ncbi:hypothetical protein [Diaphorobacter sp. ED-3]|uniref:hypothetical protein n=1 Tax=Diaphorobacter sp. ED-3 TaxID=3016636 RepID=UPI0022DDA82A|nr:hypothetical protein [Diaphorobacter sp. ED-3]
MNAQATQIIDALGGTAAVSRMFGLSMPSVSNWKKSGIPRPRMMYLEAAHADKLQGIDTVAATLPSVAEPAKTAEASHG